MDFVEHYNFHELYMTESEVPANRDLLHRMNVLNAEGTVSNDEWEAIGLYDCFAFRKR